MFPVRLTGPHPSPVPDVSLLFARIVLGIVFVAHAWQKVHTFGISGTAATFRGWGVPVPRASALYAAFAEGVGGIALLLGAFTSVAALLLVLDMLGAYVFVHLGHGVFVQGMGFELAGALGAGALLIGALGAGRFSVDEALRRGRGTAGERARA